jgi:hypothetical protein
MRFSLLLLAPAVLGACFPTMQTPEVTPGLHLDAGAMVLGDQPRDGQAQGTDLFGWVAPSFGFGHDVEVGLPVGWYLEDGLRGNTGQDAFGSSSGQLVVLPYGKVAFVDTPTHKLAGVLQLGPTFVSSLGLLYGRELRSWMPYGSVKWIASGGPAGDDPFITRYQQKGQLLLVLSGGAESRRPGLPALELGVLIDHYQEGAVYGDFGQPTTPRTLVDVFVTARVRLGRR